VFGLNLVGHAPTLSASLLSYADLDFITLIDSITPIKAILLSPFH